MVTIYCCQVVAHKHNTNLLLRLIKYTVMKYQVNTLLSTKDFVSPYISSSLRGKNVFCLFHFTPSFLSPKMWIGVWLNKECSLATRHSINTGKKQTKNLHKLCLMSWKNNYDFIVVMCVTPTGCVSPSGEGLQERPRRFAPRPGKAVDVVSKVPPELLYPGGLPLLLQHPAGRDRRYPHQREGCGDGYFLHALQQVTWMTVRAISDLFQQTRSPFSGFSPFPWLVFFKTLWQPDLYQCWLGCSTSWRVLDAHLHPLSKQLLLFWLAGLKPFFPMFLTIIESNENRKFNTKAQHLSGSSSILLFSVL